MPFAHYYDVDRELHELKHRGELVPTRNEIMGKIGASILLSYSGHVVSYVTREGLGFVRVLHSRVVVSSFSYVREIAKIPLWAACSFMKKTHHCLVQSRYARIELRERSNHFEHVLNFYSGSSVLLEIGKHIALVCVCVCVSLDKKIDCLYFKKHV